MRHPHYSGVKAENVPSVGSRLAGVVKPSYGKPKLKLESNPMKLTGDSRNFGFNSMGPNDLNAKSPYRCTHAVMKQVLGLRDLRRLDRFAHKVGKQVSKRLPVLVKTQG